MDLESSIIYMHGCIEICTIMQHVTSWVAYKHLYTFAGQFQYTGWEYSGIDVDEEDEDMEADQEAAEEEEEGGEEVSYLPSHISSSLWFITFVIQEPCEKESM